MCKGNNDKPTILMADSCAGGIVALKPFLQWAGDYRLCYLADGKNNPFGTKSPDAVFSIIEDWLQFAITQKTIMLIIACNTASVAIQNNVRQLVVKYKIPIITMVEAVEAVLYENSNNITGKNVVIFGTKLTIESKTYSSIINQYSPKRLFLLDGTATERIVARGLLTDKLSLKLMDKEINQYKDCNVETFLLACTCFEHISDRIATKYDNVVCLNPSGYISKIAKKILNVECEKKILLKDVQFLTTGDLNEWTKNINDIAKLQFGKTVDVTYV